MARTAAPKDETNAQRFIRLANIRAGNALKAIEGVGQLVGPSYESTSEQHAKIFKALKDKMDHAEKQLASGKPSLRKGASIL